MVEQMIDKNLLLYRSKAIVEAFPLDGWQYRIFEYEDRETYTPLTEWADYSDNVLFCDNKTCMMKTVFTPKKPMEHEVAYLELRLPRNCEAFVSINGVRFAGVDNDTQRCKVFLEDSMYDKENTLELEIYACSFGRDFRKVKPLESPKYVIADKVLADFSYTMDFVRDLLKYIKNDYTKSKVRALFENTIRKSVPF